MTLGLTLAVAACAEDDDELSPLEPVPAHLYVAHTIDDLPLPAHVHTTPPIGEDQQAYRVYVTYDTLRMIWNGHYERRTRLETRQLDGTFVGSTIRSDRGSWQSQGAEYHFTSNVYEQIAFDVVRTNGGATLRSDQDIVQDDDSPLRSIVYTRR